MWCFLAACVGFCCSSKYCDISKNWSIESAFCVPYIDAYYIYASIHNNLHLMWLYLVKQNAMFHAFLVGGLEHVLFFHLLGIIIPIDFPMFQRGGSTTSQIQLLSPLVFRENLKKATSTSQVPALPRTGWSLPRTKRHIARSMRAFNKGGASPPLGPDS